MIALTTNLLIFVGLNFGIASLIALRLRAARPLTRLVLGLAAALIIEFVIGFALYASDLSWRWLLILPVITLFLVLRDRRKIVQLFAAAEVRRTFAGWMLVTAWSLGLHCLIVSYSGGGWTGDEFEHFDRVRFFLERWPLKFRFLWTYGLTSRPPLANIVIADWMSFGAGRFADFQILSTLVSSLTFFPLVLLMRRFGGGRAGINLLALLLMLNPMWVENSTFPWTKLAAAFFILLAVERCLAGLNRGRGQGVACVLLGAGCIAHYSTGVWVVALGGAWLATTWSFWRQAAYWRNVILGLLVTGLVTSTWFIWAGTHYGVTSIWGETTPVALRSAKGPSQFMYEFLCNIRYTLVPAAHSPMRDWLGLQTSIWGRVRDMAFSLYQQTLPLGFGLGGLLFLTLGRWQSGISRRMLVFWIILVPTAFFLGIAVHPTIVDLGLAHICLQPLILLGIAFIASRHSRYSKGLYWIAGIGLGIDFILGIGIHFAVQALWVPPWNMLDTLNSLSQSARFNYQEKCLWAQPFIGDLLKPFRIGIVGALSVVLAISIWRAINETRQKSR